MKKLNLQTPNFTDEHIARIAEMFPHCVTEAKDEAGNLKRVINFDLLKQELSENIVDGPRERYRLEWPGKRASLVAANTPTTKTLRPAREESVDFDTTQNLYIEGDNLEALKLLQKSYLGAVKMIYIDPPYNTGKDFIYKDNFARSREEELQESGQIDEEGGRLVANLESNGRFHSDWLSMMYPRLRLARNLLKDDGVIFISIDDNEVHNLRKICDEVFGEENFVANIIWEKVHTRKNSARYFSVSHDYILIYGKKKNLWSRNLIPRNNTDAYSNPDNDPKGPWKADPIYANNPYDANYTITKPNGVILHRPEGRYWRFSEETIKEKIESNEIIWGEGDSYPMIKRYLKDVQDGLVPITIFDREFAADNMYANNEMKLLFESDKIMSYPKPSKLIYRLIQIACRTDDIILDFFSGSATTAHAVMQLNAEDGGKRKFIMVQLPEETDEKSEANKAGYRTIAEIGKERIRRAGRKIKEENADKEGIDELDIGFRVLKIDSSNMKDVYYRPDEVSRESLLDTIDHIKEDRSAEDLLFGVLVDWGVDLTLPIERREIAGKSVYFVGHGDLAACFEENLDEAFIKALAQEDVLRVVFKESGFANDETKINAEQIFKQLAPGTDVRVI